MTQVDTESTLHLLLINFTNTLYPYSAPLLSLPDYPNPYFSSLNFPTQVPLPCFPSPSFTIFISLLYFPSSTLPPPLSKPLPPSLTFQTTALAPSLSPPLLLLSLLRPVVTSVIRIRCSHVIIDRSSCLKLGWFTKWCMESSTLPASYNMYNITNGARRPNQMSFYRWHTSIITIYQGT